jgi:hypothetical protein
VVDPIIMSMLPVRPFFHLSWLWLRFLPGALALFLALTSGQATTVRPPTFAELVNESDYIVRAKVKSVTSEWREKQGLRHIFTFVELEVLEVIDGTPPQPWCWKCSEGT